MIRYENHCVGCPPEIGCLGNSCPQLNVRVCYCDSCSENLAEYRINGEMLCKMCAKSTLKQLFHDMSIYDQAEALRIDLEVLKP